VAFAAGPGLSDALDLLERNAESRSMNSARHFRRFCEQEAIDILDAPSHTPRVSACWREERDNALQCMMLRARHNDLVVLGRAPKPDGLPSALIESLLIGAGRPLLIAPHRPRATLLGTALVGWKETASSARGLSAALPLLSKAERVVIATVREGATGSRADLDDLSRYLAWHGILAECVWLPASGGPAVEQLETAIAQFDADFMVMGGYSHSRMRETIFGGCTQHFIDHAELPVLIMH
jgi:nucleotide-binding universal stress UspA family protein